MVHLKLNSLVLGNNRPLSVDKSFERIESEKTFGMLKH